MLKLLTPLLLALGLTCPGLPSSNGEPAALTASALGPPAFGQQMAVNLGYFSGRTYQNLGTFCNAASEFDLSYSHEIDEGPSTENEWTSGSTFDFFTQGGTGIALEYQHWWDFDYSVTGNSVPGCPSSNYASCFDAPPWDVVTIAIDFKVGAYWSRSFVEFYDSQSSAWETPLDQQCFIWSAGGSTWRPARFDSVSNATKVRLSIVEWTGHDSYGWGVSSACTDPEKYIDVATGYTRHILTIREPQP